mgnify:FL=1
MRDGDRGGVVTGTLSRRTVGKRNWGNREWQKYGGEQGVELGGGKRKNVLLVEAAEGTADVLLVLHARWEREEGGTRSLTESHSSDR